MRILRTISAITFLLALLLIAGCGGGASLAPPVDLPAPITGRIDVASPDADGNVTITGSEGAVTGGSTVMAVNETVAGSVAWRFIDRLIPSAFATDSFPAICSTLGHACTMSNADGSFVIMIAAAATDSIAIVLIDPDTGEHISEVVRLSAAEDAGGEVADGDGAGDDGKVYCQDKDLAGAAVAVAAAPSDGTPILLKQGSDSTTNQLVVGYPDSNPTTFNISGCYAHSIAVINNNGVITIAVTSRDDNILWTGQYSGNEIRNASHFRLDDQPMSVSFMGDASFVLAALKTADSVIFAQLSLSDGGAIRSSDLTDGAGNVIGGLTRSKRIDTVEMLGGLHMAVLLTDDGDESQAYVSAFYAEKLTHLATWSIPIFTTVLNMRDVALWLDGQSDVNIALLDPNEQTPKISLFTLTDSQGSPFGYSNNLDNVSRLGTPRLGNSSGLDFIPVNIVASHTMTGPGYTSPVAAITTVSGHLYTCSLPDLSKNNANSVATIAADHSVVGIGLDDSTGTLAFADATAVSLVNGSDLVEWVKGL